jgi:hypothetical protein
MNIDNINRVIAAVRAEPHHFVMEDWNTASSAITNFNPADRLTLARNNPCNTAGCLGGWMDSLALCDIADGKMAAPVVSDEDLKDGIGSPLYLAARFIGMAESEQGWGSGLDMLFHMDRHFSMIRFDRLPPKARAEAGARALEIFRDNDGRSNWTRALEETGLLGYMEGGEVAIDGQTYR